MKTTVIICSFLLLSGLYGNAQEYRNAVGFRGGYSSGICYQGFFNENNAVEVLLSWRDSGMQLTGIFEAYHPVMTDHYDNFFIYYGFGGHFGYTQWYRKQYYDTQPNTFYYKQKASPVMGFDGMFGFEYKLYRVPLSFSMNYKPFMEMFGEEFIKLNFHDFGFSAKLRF